MRIKLILAAMAVSVALGATGNVAPTKAAPAMPPASPTDACSLLTQAQVSAALGVTVSAGQKLMPNTPSICGWEVPGETGVKRKRVMVSIYTPIGHLTPADRFNNAKTPVKGITKTPVSGVGDDAIYATTPGLGTGLIFKKGASAFDVRVYGFTDDQVKEKEKTLALEIIAKL